MFFIVLIILSHFYQWKFSIKLYFNENQECKVRPEIINVKSNEPIFYPFSIKTSKCSGSCNNINNPYAKMCIPAVVKDLKVTIFNLMSRTNETRRWHGNGMKHVSVNVD